MALCRALRARIILAAGDAALTAKAIIGASACSKRHEKVSDTQQRAARIASHHVAAVGATW